MTQFSGIYSDFHYKECTEFAAMLVFSPPLEQHFASYFESIDS